MANYTLVVEKSKKDYRPIEWTSIDNYKKFSSKALLDIVEFTSNFHCQTELKEFLLKNEKLNLTEFGKNLHIVYNSKGEVKKLPYGLTYEEDFKFFDPDYIISYLINRRDDYHFLETLYNRYRNSFIEQSNCNAIMDQVNYLRRLEEKNLDIVSIDRDREDLNYLYYCMKNLVYKESYDYDSNAKEIKKDENGNKKLKYKSFRDLAMFISYQERKRNNSIVNEEDVDSCLQRISDDRIEVILETPTLLDNNIEKSKQKVLRKNKNIKGQLSFDDMGWI